MAKKSRSIGSGVMKVVELATSLFSIASNLTYLIETETREAGRSLVTLAVLFLFSLCVFSSLWLSALAMLFLYFASLQISMLLSLFIIFLINLVILLILTLSVMRVKKKLLFLRTRRLLRSLRD